MSRINKKTFQTITLSCLLVGIIFFILPNKNATAQIFAEDVIENVLQKPDSGSDRIFVLQFGATGMTESAARAFSNMVSQNLANTNRFDVIPLDTVETETEKQMPSLLPCFDIGCGIQMGKLMESDWILTGDISLTSSGLFSLNVKLVLIFDNSLAFEDTIRFTDETMDRQFYLLSNRIANNAPIIGTILEANNKIAVVDLGEKNGISVGDQLVIYRNLTIQSEEGEAYTESKRRKNIGILRITKVGKGVSEGVYFQTIETPESRQFVTTYLDKRKQIRLVDNIRKELDTHLRNVFEIKKAVVLSPVRLEDMAKQKWAEKIRVLENSKSFWKTFLIGSGVASLYFLNQFESSDDIKLIGALGVLGYSSYRFFSLRSQITDLVEEGKYKGYLELKVRPDYGEIGLSYQYRF
jgi:hypothetical protein